MPATVVFAVANSLGLVWMLALTRHAWRTLPPGAPVPVRRGLSGWNRWQPKESALFLWSFAGTVVWLATTGTMIYPLVTGTAPTSKAIAIVMPAAYVLPMIVLLVSERSALKTARAASRPDRTRAPFA